MQALLIGTGGADGWPQDGCRCASCMRARSAGRCRAPGRVIIDGRLEFTPYMETGPATSAAHRITQISGGWDITGPDRGRVLLSAGPGVMPDPPAGTEPFDIALLDMLADPARLGRLRLAGLVRPDTQVVALYTDHRVSSEHEMRRRCGLWAVIPGTDGQLVGAAPHSGPKGRGSPPARNPPGLPRPHRTLIIGGARSGKSTEAELRLSGEPQVTYIAAGPWPDAVATTDPRSGQQSWTGPDGEPDAEWPRRIAMHRARRPSWWRTIETLDLAAALHDETDAVLIDGIGTWLAAVMDEAGMWRAGQQPDPTPRADSDAATAVQARIDALVAAWRQTRALVVAVTDQVGSGLVPAYRAGRLFRDQLGWLNQRIAAESEQNLLVVAGRVITLTDCDEALLTVACGCEGEEMGPGSC